MTSATQTHIGYVREENQDRVGSRQFGENLLLLVCDGMGGERSGSKASSLASEVFFENFEEGYEPDMDHYSMRSLLLSSISAANSVVYTSARMDYQNFGMGTTCVAAFISQTYIAIANVATAVLIIGQRIPYSRSPSITHVCRRCWSRGKLQRMKWQHIRSGTCW